MSTIETIKMTAEQFRQLGEDPPGVRLELVEGDIRVSPSPTHEHAYTLSRLLRILGNYIELHDLGVIMSDTDHELTSWTVRRPDLYFFSKERMNLIETPIRHPPDLAVEVISEGSVRTDRKEKFAAYQDFGIGHYWLVDPLRRTADAFRLKKRKYVAAGSGKGNDTVKFPPFEDLTIALRELWWPPK